MTQPPIISDEEYEHAFGLVLPSNYVVSDEEALAQLRFVRRYAENASGEKSILQQAWRVTTFENGYATSAGIEWRDVPLVVETPEDER